MLFHLSLNLYNNGNSHFAKRAGGKLLISRSFSVRYLRFL
ncbi:hypothetical protein GCWU000282_00445 [Catonella morbi ATCC 51271]|uniref:Uncharacterized protein n=1 Tax=Catonella morbi ATCC 51271 TaxID=592026 RepID=V2XPM2_9FIRM|nr:hypothetical protein GCWU000282_00445 [Catonella morbi ATCC 51271]